MSAKGFDVVVRNNLTGGFIVSREVYTQSMQHHGGAIVNMTADYRNGFPNMVHTGAARAGMANLTMTLAFEWGVSGVRVNSVAPGWIASSGMDTYTGEFKENIPKLKNHCPLGRLGTESQRKSAVHELCRVLKPGGTLILHENSDLSVLRQFLTDESLVPSLSETSLPFGLGGGIVSARRPS